MMLFDKNVNGWTKAAIIWNAAFMLLTGLTAVADHDGGSLVWFLIFAGLLLWTIHNGRYEQALAKEKDESTL